MMSQRYIHYGPDQVDLLLLRAHSARAAPHGQFGADSRRRAHHARSGALQIHERRYKHVLELLQEIRQRVRPARARFASLRVRIAPRPRESPLCELASRRAYASRLSESASRRAHAICISAEIASRLPRHAQPYRRDHGERFVSDRISLKAARARLTRARARASDPRSRLHAV